MQPMPYMATATAAVRLSTTLFAMKILSGNRSLGQKMVCFFIEGVIRVIVVVYLRSIMLMTVQSLINIITMTRAVFSERVE